MKEEKRNYSAKEVLEEMIERAKENGYTHNYIILEESENYILVGEKYEDEGIARIDLQVVHAIKNGDKVVSVYVNQNYKGGIKNADLNWCAIGSTTPEVAREYAKQINNAADFVELINGKDYSDRF